MLPFMDARTSSILLPLLPCATVQLGIGNETARGQTPEDMGAGLAIVDLGTGRTATHVACGNRHSCAVLDNGSLKCWGNGDSGM